MISAKILSSISDIHEDSWNEIVGRNQLICRHEYLRAVESSRINDCRYYYVMLYDGERLLAHTCLYTISTELDAFAQGGIKRLIAKIRSRWPSFMMLRSLECGTPVALGTTLCLREDADKTELLKRFVVEIEKLAQSLHIHVLLIRDFYEKDLPWANALIPWGYSRIENLPCAHMELRWKTYQEYLDSMRSQYRCKLLTQVKRCREHGVTLELVNDYGSYASQLALLWKNAFDHAKEYRREILLEDFFLSMNRHLASRSSAILAWKEQTLVGFLLLFKDEDVLTTIFSGLDYTCNRETGVYFNMFYRSIELAIEQGFKEIDFGITTVAPKIDLGAVAKPLYMYMKHRHKGLNLLVPKIFAAMTPKTELTSRNVFK